MPSLSGTIMVPLCSSQGGTPQATHRLHCLTNGGLPLSSIPAYVPRLPAWRYKGAAKRRETGTGERSREVSRAQRATNMEAIHLLLALVLLSGSLGSGQGLEEGLGSQEFLAEDPNVYPERLSGWMQENEDHAAQSLPEEHSLGVLLRSFLHAVQRPGRSPSFLFQPQRFGRDARAGSLSVGRIKARAWDSMAPQFLSMATPQRFGKKK
nr:pro-FMRFamide-related neuropeptide FF [Pogona vitticeps]